MTEFLQVAQLQEHPGDRSDAREMIEDLLADHQAVIRLLTQSVDDGVVLDAGTVDFLTRLMRDHEHIAWMLRATLSR